MPTFSLFLPNIHEGRFIPMGALGPDHMFRPAELAEELGYEGIWIGEFMESQADVTAQFRDPPPSYYAPITLLAMLAARTSRVRLTTGVLVLPYHDPLILAREVATLDVLSGGRITLGTGLGGSIENYRRTRKLHGPLNRAKLMEESVRAMRVLWQQRRATFVGEYFEFHDVEMFPKPLQRALPIVMAGGADAVVERIGRLANGWIDTYLLPDAMRVHLEALYASARNAGRAGERFEIMRSFFCSIAATDEAAQQQRQESVPGGRPTGRPNDSEREFLLVGSPDTIIRQLRRYDGIGITEFNIAFYHRDVPTALAQIRLFAREVFPAFAINGAERAHETPSRRSE
jgi:probable F420-dependent oxidoreductase